MQRLSIKMSNASFHYGFEYLGVGERLVQRLDFGRVAHCRAMLDGLRRLHLARCGLCGVLVARWLLCHAGIGVVVFWSDPAHRGERIPARVGEDAAETVRVRLGDRHEIRLGVDPLARRVQQ